MELNIHINKILTVRDGFELGNCRYLLNSEREESLFEVKLGTGTIQAAVFYVDARDVQSAVDRVVDFCEENNYKGYYTEYSDLEEEAEKAWNKENESAGLEEVDVDKYIEESGLTAAGNHSVYIELLGVKEIN